LRASKKLFYQNFAAGGALGTAFDYS